MSEYQASLQNWVRGLTDAQLGDYMGALERFTDAELDALFLEDVRRMQTRTVTA